VKTKKEEPKEERERGREGDVYIVLLFYDYITSSFLLH
jgi:hypothetical protein